MNKPNQTPETFIRTFLESKFEINMKNLLLLYFEQMGDDLEKAIFQDGPNSKFIFTKETLNIIIEEEFISKTFSKKDLLNIFANQNESLIGIILALKIFEKIYIINDIEDFETEALNIRQGSALSFELLESKTISEKIIIKYLMNRYGEINLRYIDHLDRCSFLMRSENIQLLPLPSKDFLINFDKTNLQKIMARFSLKKFLFMLYEGKSYFLNQQHIENIIFINQDFIDFGILEIILNNYFSFTDENRIWLRKIFKSRHG